VHALVVLALLVAGLPDRGIFPELDARVTASVPGWIAVRAPWLRVDRRHGVITLYDGDTPLKAYPLLLREADLAELARVAPGARRVEQPVGRDEDRDGDGIVDPLDIALGARKLLHNGARYLERYVSIGYPGGDVPRTEGVCSDTVIRALRNAGIDLQKEVHEDILRDPGAYPMVEKVDASINHRRVRTILPWFQRHFTTLPPSAPYLPGDIVFFDTFPTRPGPDHLGVVSDTLSPTGRPLIINNWTDGATDAEMDLLSFVPVTHHFRVAGASSRAAASRSRP
jgi:uncharacterized protein YijF (DUF1287 family)